MRITAVFLVLLVSVLSVGCMRAPVIPPPGAFNFTKAPLDVDYDGSNLGSKRGESSTHCVLGLVAWGDASTKEAAYYGMSTITHADYAYLNVLGLYQKYTTIVYGD